MKSEFLSSNRFAYLIILFMLALYLAFPTANSSIDAWSYAASVKWQVEIFRSHHLLYNAVPLLLYQALVWLGIHTHALSLSIMINAFFAAFSLLILYHIFLKINTDRTKRNALLLFAGSSFALMRFATENETYIIPLFFSLWGSFYFLRAFKEEKSSLLILSGFFAALACLFHQIHFFWWLILLLAILFRKDKSPLKKAIFYLLPALIVPIIYFLVIAFYLKQNINYNNSIHFVFEEFFRGNVDHTITLNNFMFFFISLIRSFFQVHGYFLILIQKHVFFIVPAILSVFLVIWGLLKSGRFFQFRLTEKYFFRIHVYILIFQLLFAFYSVGNAEFMVMVPPLLAILISMLHNIRQSLIWKFALAMLVWNLFLGIIPMNRYEFSNSGQLSQKINKHSDIQFILFDKILLDNRYFYDHGKYPEHLINSPYYFIKRNREEELRQLIDDALDNSKIILTDCSGNELLINRAAIMQKEINEEFLNKYKLNLSDSVSGISGKTYLYRIKIK